MTNRAVSLGVYEEHIHLCPRCASSNFVDYSAPPVVTRLAAGVGVFPPALSRSDNETDVCSHCGTEEAMIEFSGGRITGPSDWPLVP